MACDLAAWTELLRALQPFFVLVMILPVVSRVLRAYEAFLASQSGSVSVRKPTENGSDE